MAIVNSASGTSSGAASITLNYTPASNANALVVAVVLSSSAANPPGALTWNGSTTGVTTLVSIGQYYVGVMMYLVTSPGTAAADAVWTQDFSTFSGQIVIYELSNYVTATPYDAGTIWSEEHEASATTAWTSGSIASDAGDIIIETSILRGTQTALTPNSGQSASVTNIGRHMASAKTTAGTTTVGWTWTGAEKWTAAAVNFNMQPASIFVPQVIMVL